MGELIDCSNEFKIRQRVNKVRQIAYEKGWGDKILVTIQPDPTVDTGYGIVIYDRGCGQRLALNMDLFKGETA